MTEKEIGKLHRRSFRKLARMYFEAGREWWPTFDLVIEKHQELFAEVCKAETRAYREEATEAEVKQAILTYWYGIKAGFEKTKGDTWTGGRWKKAA